MTAREGLIPFDHPSVSRTCLIWYTIKGDWPAKGRPLVTLHGGPGYTHDSLLPLADLSRSPFNRTVIFFDQVGSGRSTHLPEKYLDYAFWTEEFFMDQLDAVVKYFCLEDGVGYDLYGHSWGGMLGSRWASTQPQGLSKLVIAHSPVASRYWLEKCREYRSSMPDHYRKVLEEERSPETWRDSEYLEAIAEFNKRHFMSVNPIPPELQRSYDYIASDPTATISSLGPDEFIWKGFMNSWSIIGEAHNIKCRTLVINGTNEGVDHEESVRIWRSELPDHEYFKFTASTHFSHFEERDLCINKIGKFLQAER